MVFAPVFAIFTVHLFSLVIKFFNLKFDEIESCLSKISRYINENFSAQHMLRATWVLLVLMVIEKASNHPSPLIGESSFLSTVQPNPLFIEFGNIVYELLARNLRGYKNLGEFRSELRENHFEEIVESFIVIDYNQVWLPCVDHPLKSTTATTTSAFCSKIVSSLHKYIGRLYRPGMPYAPEYLVLSNVNMYRPPSNAIRFLKSPTVYLVNTGIGDIDSLYYIDSITCINASSNNITKLPRFDKFTNLKEIHLSNNPIVISGIHEIRTNGKLRYGVLSGINGLYRWKNELDAIFNDLVIVDPVIIDKKEDARNQPDEGSKDQLDEDVRIGVQKIILEWMHEWILEEEICRLEQEKISVNCGNACGREETNIRAYEVHISLVETRGCLGKQRQKTHQQERKIIQILKDLINKRYNERLISCSKHSVILSQLAILDDMIVYEMQDGAKQKMIDQILNICLTAMNGDII